MGMEYEHARAAHLHRHLDMYGGPHMGGSHRMDDRARDMRGDMLMPHSGYAPPHLKGAWDSPSAQYDLRVGGLPPTSGHMPLHHRSPRHGPMPPPGKSPQHGPKRSPHHGPMRPPPHGGIPNTKSPRHSPMPGHSNEMRGEMLPPSSNGAWLKSPGLSHMKPKKIPGSVASILETPPLTSCRRGMAQADPNPISLGDPSMHSNNNNSHSHNHPTYLRLAA